MARSGRSQAVPQSGGELGLGGDRELGHVVEALIQDVLSGGFVFSPSGGECVVYVGDDVGGWLDAC
jgi:hypothetical protein